MKFMFRNDAESYKLKTSHPLRFDFQAEVAPPTTPVGWTRSTEFLVRDSSSENEVSSSVLSFGIYVSDTWMCLERGEGEKEIENHGWSRVKKVFSQETGAISQCVSKIDTAKMKRPQQRSKSQVQDAHDSLTQLPFFSLSNHADGIELEPTGSRGAA